MALAVVVGVLSPRTHLHQVRRGGNTGPAPSHAAATQSAEPSMICSRVSEAQPHSKSPGVQSFAASAFTHDWAQDGTFDSWTEQSFVAEAKATKVAKATGKRNFILKL